ncbi:Golgin candidate 4 [Heracleum sosnowskyi]|uniref:Golgin candidate 4 n=1 Tax=Heracleum sosnowskyi TaxID=360622 RepID=A0AAD8ML67_9APIA|nr:Golgin candidate 4 [Heracleum sosnowskyi]
MMWSSSLASFKENLNKIAQDVHDDDDEYDDSAIYNSNDRNDSPVSNRRFSDRSVSYSNSNGFDSAHDSEIDQYRAQIKKLQHSEAEIKALSVNYAALLKEKEDYISRINEENSSLKQNLASEQSANRQYKAALRKRSSGSPTQNGSASKHDMISNGIASIAHAGGSQSTVEPRRSSIQGNEKDHALLEERNRQLEAKHSSQELKITQLGMELDNERCNLAEINRKFEDERTTGLSIQEELGTLKVDKDKMFVEMSHIRNDLNHKIAEIGRLQMELSKRDNSEVDSLIESLKRAITSLEMENSSLKTEKDKLVVALEASTKTVRTDVSETVQSNEYPGKEEMESSMRKMARDLKDACREKEKALQQLNRLKQHLLEKESEESEKMDEDSKIIEELRAHNEYLRAQILQMEKALKQATASQEEVHIKYNEELKKSKEINDDLNKKLSSFRNTISAKNDELLNLQTALGQYYAEIEAKEELEEKLTIAREESAKLTDRLNDAYQQVEILKRDKEEILAKLSEAERLVGDSKSRVNKVEEDNAKLRRALEQSMTRLNRMSLDSDYFVDRRIVIKLMVTYFQRNHSKEVLDLMVRMLGFTDEDKQKIGVAQQGAGKGVVRGVLGLPGRLVGGIMGGSSAEGSASTSSENQSFADLWVDFLLKETEERERAKNESTQDQHGADPSTAGSLSSSGTNASPVAASGLSRWSSPLNQDQTPLLPHGNLQIEHTDSEFSTVPLSESNPQLSRLLPRY